MAEQIQFQSALPQLFNTLVGQKTTSGGGSTTQTTTTGSANTDPLTAAFTSAMGQFNQGIGGYQALIDSIFQQGAQQVPSLIGAYANATGSRASNNSGLRLALDELNKSLSTQALQAILANQQQSLQTATQAGGQIAQATRSTTQNSNQQQQNTQKQGIGNPKTGYGAMLGGFLLNQADKRGLLNGIKNPFGGASADPTYMSGPVPASVSNFMSGPDPFANNPMIEMPQIAPTDMGFGSSSALLGGNFNNPTNFGEVGLDVANAFGGMDFGTGSTGFDYGSAVDFGSNVGGLADYAWDGSDPGFFDDMVDLGGFFDNISFRNGGMVRMNPRMRPRGYANGGIVSPEMPPRYLVDARGRANQYSDPRSTVYVPIMGQALQTPNPAPLRGDRFASGGVVRNRPNMGQRPNPVQTAAVNYRQPDATDAILDAGSGMPGGASMGVTNVTLNDMASRFGAVGGVGGNAVPLPRPELVPGMQLGPRGVRGVSSISTGPSGEQEGLAQGQTGTEGENSAAAAGAGIAAISALTGIPGIALGIAADVLGIPNTPMNPITQAITVVGKTVAQALGLTGGVAADAAPPTEGGMSTVGSVDSEGNVAPMSTTGSLQAEMNPFGFSPITSPFGGFSPTQGDTGIGLGLGIGSIDPSVDSVGGESTGDSSPTGPGGTSGSGVDASGAATSGVDGDSGVGSTAAYKSGGLVRGPGSTTSDSIRVAAKDPGGPDIRYSDKEFVIPAEVVRMTGAGPWQALVNAFNMPKA